MMTNNKEERDKDVVHKVFLFLQLLLINILHVINFHRTFNNKGSKNKNRTKGDSDMDNSGANDESEQKSALR